MNDVVLALKQQRIQGRTHPNPLVKIKATVSLRTRRPVSLDIVRRSASARNSEVVRKGGSWEMALALVPVATGFVITDRLGNVEATGALANQGPHCNLQIPAERVNVPPAYHTH